MGLQVKSPMTVEVTNNGLTNILPALPAGQIYKIYAIQLVSTRRSRVVTLLENDVERWRGWIQQRTDKTLNFGNMGWDLAEHAELNFHSQGSITMNVNILQWCIVDV